MCKCQEQSSSLSPEPKCTNTGAENVTHTTKELLYHRACKSLCERPMTASVMVWKSHHSSVVMLCTNPGLWITVGTLVLPLALAAVLMVRRWTRDDWGWQHLADQTSLLVEKSSYKGWRWSQLGYPEMPPQLCALGPLPRYLPSQQKLQHKVLQTMRIHSLEPLVSRHQAVISVSLHGGTSKAMGSPVPVQQSSGVGTPISIPSKLALEVRSAFCWQTNKDFDSSLTDAEGFCWCFLQIPWIDQTHFCK